MANELIVLIEDNEKNRKLARDVLTHQGYRVAEAESAEDGLALIARERPRLVLMDIHLPGIITSRSTRSSGSRSISARASGPAVAVSTV